MDLTGGGNRAPLLGKNKLTFFVYSFLWMVGLGLSEEEMKRFRIDTPLLGYMSQCREY